MKAAVRSRYDLPEVRDIRVSRPVVAHTEGSVKVHACVESGEKIGDLVISVL
jgi:hypothetical protein